LSVLANGLFGKNIFKIICFVSRGMQSLSLISQLISTIAVQAEVFNIEVAAKSSEYTDVQLSADDVRPGRTVIAEHTKVCDNSLLVSVVSRILSVTAIHYTSILTV